MTKNRVVVYSINYCPYCTKALKHLEDFNQKHDLDFSIEEIKVHLSPQEEQVKIREYLFKQTGQKTFPQIVIGSQHVGGYSDLVEIELETFKQHLDSCT